MSSLTFPPEHESETPRCEHGRSIESVCEFCDDEKIEALEARVAELEAGQRPRPMYEAPTDGTRILITVECYWSKKDDGWVDTAGDNWEVYEITQWLPMPEQCGEEKS